MARRGWASTVAVAGLLLATSCGGRVGGAAASSTSTTSTTVSTTTTAPTPTSAPPGVIEVALRLERRTADRATSNFARVVTATLTDGRGWERAGFRFTFTADAPYTVVLAEGPEVDELCRPYDTGGTYSCQLGPVVALNADRWRTATPKWTGDLAEYRQMLVNHEVGHLLGQHHPPDPCPGPGAPAPVLAQQSTELHGCLPNPWPLDAEIAAAARHDHPLAPGFRE